MHLIDSLISKISELQLSIFRYRRNLFGRNVQMIVLEDIHEIIVVLGKTNGEWVKSLAWLRTTKKYPGTDLAIETRGWTCRPISRNPGPKYR